MTLRVLSIAFLLSVFLGSISGCESTHNSQVSTGLSVTGEVGQILVVCEPGIWNSDLKRCLDTNLTQWILPYLPDVATFELTHKTPAHFTQGVRRYRNTLFITIDANHKEDHGKIEKRMDVWAKDQMVVDIVAKDFDQLIEACQYGLDEVHDEFDDMSWRRLMNRFGRNTKSSAREAIAENFGIDIALPNGAKLVSKRKNFYRIEFPSASRPIEFVGSGTQDVGTIFSGIMIYQYDYKDSTQFELERLLNARDTMLKYNVPHEIEGMYMGTQYNEFVFPEGDFTANASGSIKGYDMRGMFMFKGLPKHSTGGAFWAFHFINPNTQKLMCISGYVDAPSTTSWTHPLREVQAILRSVELK